MRPSTIGATLLATLLLTGCIFAPDGGGYRYRDEAPRPTLGQELLDLNRAREAGALSDAEYELARERLLDRR